MDIQPYSIYLENRPFRIAFLIAPNTDRAWFDRILEFNREKWGGRFNPVIFCDGDDIGEPWWSFLKSYDPDIIYSTVDLSDVLQQRINTFLTPLYVEKVSTGGAYIRISEEPLSIGITAKNLSRVSGDMFGSKSSLALFEFDESTPVLIRQFIETNFGKMEHGGMMTYHTKKALEGCETKAYKVSDIASLNEALLDLGEFHNRVVFASQVCSLPNKFKGVEYNSINEHFQIVVGDSVDDLVYFWNRTIGIADWLRTRITSLWIPKELAENLELRPGLSKFINRFTGQTGNNGHQTAHFVTLSIPDAEIQKIALDVAASVHHPRKAERFPDAQVPNFSSLPFFFMRQDLELYRAHSNEEHLVIGFPDIEEGVEAGQHWFTDLYIQYRPERFKHIIGKDYWWQLPKRNGLLQNLNFFNKPARINEHGMFSVLLREKTRFSHDDQKLIVKLPEESRIFGALFCGEKYSCYAKDGRERFLSRPYYHTQRSDKGKYFSGILSLFPDLSSTHGVLESRYWRKIFEKMANQNLEKDPQRIAEVTATLTKSIARGGDFQNNPDDVNWLAEKVFKLAKSHSKKEVDLSLQDFLELGQAEIDEYNQKNKSSNILDADEIKDAIDQLLQWKMFLIGLKPKCAKCGYKIWYHLDEVNQTMVCKGCGYKFTVESEGRWFYHLNSLARSAFSDHGTVPVLLTLGQLEFDIRTSFVYSPSLDLYKKDSGSEEVRLHGEVDLACIADGKFVIGEIKQSVGLFDVKDFKKMGEIAKDIKPDIIIFGSMDKEPSNLVRTQIEALKVELADLEIKVEWFQLHPWVFEARPL